ncbi:MAG: hypothetical protein ACRBDI_02905 [Alphaproteobacteria bacterium]
MPGLRLPNIPGGGKPNLTPLRKLEQAERIERGSKGIADGVHQMQEDPTIQEQGSDQPLVTDDLVKYVAEQTNDIYKNIKKQGKKSKAVGFPYDRMTANGGKITEGKSVIGMAEVIHNSGISVENTERYGGQHEATVSALKAALKDEAEILTSISPEQLKSLTTFIHMPKAEQNKVIMKAFEDNKNKVSHFIIPSSDSELAQVFEVGKSPYGEGDLKQETLADANIYIPADDGPSVL